MITTLTIKNYALIQHLEAQFSNGLISITGETGAGKSILLGALSLILGKRADITTLKDKDIKCFIEGTFSIADYNLKGFFKKHGLDYESITIIRREIIPEGKSRAFINDTPVNLEVLKELSEYLIDIHSQHQTLLLKESHFQFQVLDAFADTLTLVSEYQTHFTQWKHAEKEYKEVTQKQTQYQEQKDYNTFLYEELEAANLEEGTLAPLEEELSQLLNAEELAQLLGESHQILDEEEHGVLNHLRQVKINLSKASELSQKNQKLLERIEDSLFELEDISKELEDSSEHLEANPARLEVVESQVKKIYDLQKKHNTESITELIAVKDSLQKKLQVAENVEGELQRLKELKDSSFKKVEALAVQIQEKRTHKIAPFTEELEKILAYLGMESTRFQIELTQAENYNKYGKDDLEFLASINTGTPFKPIKKIASGGELSRIMLTIKAILSQYKKLPTIIFDEIDTGVSGAISDKIAKVMKRMSSFMQVFTITHLPQVAAKGNYHFKVYKQTENDQTTTQLKRLKEEERIQEIAQMLSGQELKESALEHAKELLGGN